MFYWELYFGTGKLFRESIDRAKISQKGTTSTVAADKVIL